MIKSRISTMSLKKCILKNKKRNCNITITITSRTAGTLLQETFDYRFVSKKLPVTIAFT